MAVDWGILTIGIVILFACVNTGLGLFFMTERFARECENRGNKVRDFKVRELDDLLDNLCSEKSRTERNQESVGFPPGFLSKLREVAQKGEEVEHWFDVVVEGKKALRMSGKHVVLFGVSLFLSFAVASAVDGDYIMLAVGLIILLAYGSFFTFVIMVRNLKEYCRIVNEIDETYKDLVKGDLSKMKAKTEV